MSDHYSVPGPLIPEGFVAVIVSTVLILLMCAGLFYGAQWIDYQSCENVRIVTHNQTRFVWGIGGQCFVRSGAEWVPLHNWREGMK